MTFGSQPTVRVPDPGVFRNWQRKRRRCRAITATKPPTACILHQQQTRISQAQFSKHHQVRHAYSVGSVLEQAESLSGVIGDVTSDVVSDIVSETSSKIGRQFIGTRTYGWQHLLPAPQPLALSILVLLLADWGLMHTRCLPECQVQRHTLLPRFDPRPQFVDRCLIGLGHRISVETEDSG